MSDEDIGGLFSDDMGEYSSPSSFAGLCTAVLLIHGKTIVIMFVQHGIGHSFFRRHCCRCRHMQ
jgi:hypothetical protein